MVKESKVFLAFVATAIGLASSAFAATPTADHIVLGPDWNQPTRCKDANVDSQSISEAKVGSTVWAAVNASGLYGWGFFGSSLANPPDVNGVPFYTAFPTMRRWYRYGDGKDQPAADRAPYNPPNANYDYWISNSDYGGGLTTPNDGSVNSHFGANHVYKFEGRSLTIDGTIQHCSKGSSICDFGDNVIIKGGEYSFPALGNNVKPVLRMKAKVEGNFQFNAGSGMQNRDACFVDVSLTGDADSSVITVYQSGGAKNYSATWYWCGDCSDYRGKILLSNKNSSEDLYSIFNVSNVVCGGAIEIQQYQHLRLLGANAEVKGKVEVQNLGVFDVVAGTSKVGSLDLQGELNFSANTGKLQVNGDITIGETARIVLPADAEHKPLLTFPSSAAFSLEDFIAAVERCESNPAIIAVENVSDDGAVKTIAVVLNMPVDRTLDITSDSVMNTLDATYRVNVKNGASLTMQGVAETRMAVDTEEGAEVILSKDNVDWQSLPTVWLDASAANTVSNLTAVFEDSTYNHGSKYNGLFVKVGTTYADNDGNPYVVGWFDWRPSQTTYKIWNERYDSLYTPSGGTASHAGMFGTHPRRVLGGFNGKDYIIFDKAPPNATLTFDDGSEEGLTVKNIVRSATCARIYVHPYSQAPSSGTKKSVPFKYVFMVFGSQDGGGDALVGGNAKLARAGTTGSHSYSDAILAVNELNAATWLDGVSKDPLTSGFDGDWQVVTLNVPNGSSFSALGYLTNGGGTDNGGQRYAEIIVIDQDLTEKQRQAIEIYLAEKWGIADKYAYPDWAKKRFATVYGKGTVTLGADAKLGGAFKGTINLNGNNLTLDGAALPPGTNALDTTGLEGWYDPDAEGKTTEQGPTKMDLISIDGTVTNKNGHTIQPESQMVNLWDVARPKAEGSLHIYGQPQRAPWLNKTARAYGPARKWMEFSNLATVDKTRYKGVSDGKVLRFSKVNKSGGLDGSSQQQPMQTLFMVQDSVHGGGHPFADGVNVASPVLYVRRTESKAAVGQPIYPAGSSSILTDGITCLDGREVNGLTESFGARPEVLTVVPTEMFSMVAIGQYQNSENLMNGPNEVIGEIMIYNRKLEAAERKVVEAYLAYKWLGIAQAGYSAMGDATVTGAGTVKAASVDMLPKFGAGFTGTVEVPSVTAFDFTVNTENGVTTCVNPFDLGGGTMVLSGEITVTVNGTGARPAAGSSIKVFGWGTEPAGVTWNFVQTGTAETRGDLVKKAGGIYYEVPTSGMILLVR